MKIGLSLAKQIWAAGFSHGGWYQRSGRIEGAKSCDEIAADDELLDKEWSFFVKCHLTKCGDSSNIKTWKKYNKLK